jgi:signal transduction histidine kinase
MDLLRRFFRSPPAQVSPSPPALRARTGDEEADPFWLLTALFVIAVSLLHALIIGIALFQAVEAFPLAHQSLEPTGVITTVVARTVSLLPAIALLYFLHSRFGLVGERGSVFRALFAIVVAATLEWALFLAGMTFLDWGLGADARAFTPAHPYGIGYRVVVLSVGTLLFWGGLQWQRAKSLELRAAKAEASLRMSEMTRLEEQVHPHFLFNALTAVLACRHDPEAVASVTIGLSEHLRFCLSRQGTLEPLSRELDALQHYLTVQRARFGKTLDCRIDCTPEARDVLVPSAVIEPLLDNALKHGAMTSPTPLRIVVDCRTEGGELVITVDNSGTWIEPTKVGRQGTGLANLRNRMELLGFQDAALECGPSGDGVRARVRLPLDLPPAVVKTRRTAALENQR